MIGGVISFALWLLGLLFKPKSAVQEGREAGIAEVQKDEAQNALKKITAAEVVRDNVRRLPAGKLRDDPGNLYRD